MKNPTIGELREVEGVEGGRREVTVAAREVVNGRAFYRVKELPGSLFLNGSLKYLERNVYNAVD